MRVTETQRMEEEKKVEGGCRCDPTMSGGKVPKNQKRRITGSVRPSLLVVMVVVVVMVVIGVHSAM